ncbi:MAG: hypothetical protein A3D41_00595 [Candidatus Sungbacteria bacterium RIFCSPHIGHO2_02_FULL_41_12b]|nr:MAG: hypothetical protein A3D41_00595 [Candidatus Sungbacteria bacterium RIFCSPHIGHO2_02_FULL_41_12b]
MEEVPSGDFLAFGIETAQSVEQQTPPPVGDGQVSENQGNTFMAATIGVLSLGTESRILAFLIGTSALILLGFGIYHLRRVF